VDCTKTQNGYIISGTVRIADLTTLQLPKGTTLDLTRITDIDDLSIIFLRSSGLRVLPPRTRQWFAINAYLNQPFDPPQTPQRKQQTSIVPFLLNMLRAFHSPTTLASENTWLQLRKIGWGTLPISLFVGTIFGIVTAYQLLSNIKCFGLESLTPRMIAIIVVNHVGPIMGAQLITTQCASAIAADITSARANEEWDALISMNHNPYHALCWPRFIACVVASLLLVFVTTMTSVLASALFLSTQLLHNSFDATLNTTRLAISADIGFVMLFVRGLCFGCIISGIALYVGVTHNLSKGVGPCVNTAVYWINFWTIVTHLGIQALSTFFGY
jgi:phospholipid/cholesterol/gamma-HCH transport system permease protein